MEASQKQVTRKRTARSDAQSKVFPKMRFLTLTRRRPQPLQSLDKQQSQKLAQDFPLEQQSGPKKGYL